MTAVRRVLIVGGGIAGMCAAIQLRKDGVDVDLIEVDRNWQVYGAGITLLGPTLRAFTEVGIVDDILEHGWCADGLDVCTAAGEKLSELPTPRVGRADVPGGGAILRPVLARILREHTLASGTAVRCGVSFESMELVGEQVQVTCTDGRRDVYDLVIGADGLMSKVRETIFPDAPAPKYTGQGSWRAVIPRPADVTHLTFFMGKQIKAGVNPVSKTEMYLIVTEPRATPEYLPDEVLPNTLRQLLAEFGGLIGKIRDGLDQRSRIVYRPFWSLLLPKPWYRGRVVVIGDAAHSTTPHLASGAGIGVEDAIVLAQELARSESVEPALAAFAQRRFERCRMVVENSFRIGEIERIGGSREEHAQLTRDSIAMLAAPY